MKLLLLSLAASGLLSSPSGTGSEARVSAPGPQESATLKGTTRFKGDAPRRRKVDMGSDPSCHDLQTGEALRDESIIVDDGGGLANVFVWVSKGIDKKAYSPAEPAVLDQKGCCYTPHVLGMQVGQKLVVRNSDPVTHNVHSFAKKNKAFNQSQQAGGKEIEQVFEREEVLMKIKCDIHGWMSTYIGVVSHPFFAVTKEDGSFEIPNLPAGDYTLSARHEVFGTQKTTLTVGAGAVQEASFEFAEE